jgi:hypothetical protein
MTRSNSRHVSEDMYAARWVWAVKIGSKCIVAFGYIAHALKRKSAAFQFYSSSLLFPCSLKGHVAYILWWFFGIEIFANSRLDVP